MKHGNEMSGDSLSIHVFCILGTFVPHAGEIFHPIYKVNYHIVNFYRDPN